MPRQSLPDAVATGPQRGRLLRPRVPTRRLRVLHSSYAYPAEQTLAPLFVLARDALVGVEAASGRIVMWNPAAETLFGYAFADAIDQHLDILLPPAESRLQRERLAHYARTGESELLNVREHVHLAAVTVDGDEIRAELTVVPMPTDSAAGSRRFVLFAFRDVSEPPVAEPLRHADDLLRDSERELERARARARRSTDRLVSMALLPGVSPARVDRMARVAERRSAIVQRTLEQIDDLVAIRAGTFALSRERVNLVPLVARVATRTRKRSAAHPLNLGAPQGLTTCAEPRRLEAVVQLLVDGAIARNPRGCWIDVDLSRPLAGLARLEVRDYGRPLSDAERDHLPYGPAPDRGWYLCREIVVRHGGTLTCDSRADGGLRVLITLPVIGGRARHA